MSESKTITETGTGDALSSALGAMLSNPEMLGVISSLAKELKDSSQPPTEPKEPEVKVSSPPPAAENDMSALVGKLAPLLSGASSAGSKKEDAPGDSGCYMVINKKIFRANFLCISSTEFFKIRKFRSFRVFTNTYICVCRSCTG